MWSTAWRSWRPAKPGWPCTAVGCCPCSPPPENNRRAAPIRADSSSLGMAAASCGRCLEALLEPVVRVGLVVEGRHLAVAGRPVQRDRLGQRLVGLPPQDPDAVRGRLGLELGQQPAAPAAAADRGRDPPPLDLGAGAGGA